MLQAREVVQYITSARGSTVRYIREVVQFTTLSVYCAVVYVVATGNSEIV